ncbi:MAG TPA: DUF885 family protein [Gemmatimonadales bacterium]|nr:DUF885 family protein [Gemmatimonadales bacterium]
MAASDELCRSFLDLWYHFDPAAATRAGAPGQDERLGAFDADSVRLHVAALRSIAGAIEDLDIDDTDDEIDRTALLDHIRVLLFRFEHEHPWRRNPALWARHACESLDSLLSREVPDAAVAAATLARIRALPRFFGDARETLRRPPQLLVEVALAELDGLSTLVVAAAARFAPVWLAMDDDGAGALAEADNAIDRMKEALRSEIVADATAAGAAIGEEEVDRRLHHEHASVHNAAEVYRGALRLATEVEQEVIALAAVIDPGRPWREVYERTIAAGGPTGGLLQPMATALGAARRFAESRGLTSGAGTPLIPADATGYERALELGAFYRPAGTATPAMVVVAGGDHSALPWIAVRLGVPGIHLHRSRCDALPRMVRRHIAAASTPLGWSLYATELMRSLGYAPDPEARLAERVLFLRDAHLAVVDLALHTRQLSPTDAIGYLSTRLPIDRHVAETDVRRIACNPIEACAAILGWRELTALRDDVRAARGSRFSLSAFHDDVFAYGGLPVPLIRWGLGLDG